MNTEKEAKAGVSLNDLDTTKASSEPFEFEYINHRGMPSGIFFSVLGGESEVVKAETARLQNERRQKAVTRQINAKIGVGARAVDYDKFEDDVAYGRRIAAARLVGWRGIKDPFTPAAALQLCQSNDHIAAAITAQSEAMENFIKL